MLADPSFLFKVGIEVSVSSCICIILKHVPMHEFDF